MNLLALKSKVIEKLRERSTPRHWTATEIVSNINRGCKKFAGDSKAREQRLPLYAVDLSSGLFAFPDRILKQTGVYYNNIKLDQVDSDYLDNTYSSEAKTTTIGDGLYPAASWRESTAEKPLKWLIEDGMVRMFPIPSAMTSAVSLRKAQETTLAAGAVDIVVAGPLPTDKNLIDVYLGGVYQNKDQWNVLNETTIRMVGSLVVDVTAEVVFFDGVTTGNTKAFKYTFSLAAGAQSILLPRPYILSDNAISLKLNGISQAPSSFTESSAYSILLAAPLVVASFVEVTIYERIGAFPATVKCVRMPTEMVNDTDEPDLPGHLEDYHDALWMWALVECFSREGQEKDMSMASFYGGLYASKLSDYKTAFGAPINIAPRDAWRI